MPSIFFSMTLKQMAPATSGLEGKFLVPKFDGESRQLNN